MAGMKLARQLMHSSALAPFLDYEVYTGPHMMGTCRMGPNTDPTAVVDDSLRVYGLDGLRVIDASIMPTMLSANLNAGAMVIGEKGSDMVLGKPALEPLILPANAQAI